ncbi:hypothetical protein R078131_00458 [Convivina intestini]|nr:hypothetical protein R078131_00458 [Convivina intestini]
MSEFNDERIYSRKLFQILLNQIMNKFVIKCDAPSIHQLTENL